jgi:hypothetical protein
LITHVWNFIFLKKATMPGRFIGDGLAMVRPVIEADVAAVRPDELMTYFICLV